VKSEDAVKMARELAVKEGLLVSDTKSIRFSFFRGLSSLPDDYTN